MSTEKQKEQAPVEEQKKQDEKGEGYTGTTDPPDQPPKAACFVTMSQKRVWEQRMQFKAESQMRPA